MWLQLSLGSILPELCSGEEHGGKMVDGVKEGEVRSEAGKRGFFINMTTVLPSSHLLRDHPGSFGGRGTVPRPDAKVDTPELARPQYNSGRNGVPRPRP